MKRRITRAVLVICCYILQTTVFRTFEMGQVTPNILLILTVSFGFMQGKKEGILTGFLSGLIIDIFHGDILGVYAMIYMYIGYISGFFSKIYFDDDLKVPLIMIAGGDMIYNVIIYLLFFMMQGKLQFYSYLKTVFLPEIVYTVLISIVLYRLFYILNQYLVKDETRGNASLWLRN